MPTTGNAVGLRNIVSDMPDSEAKREWTRKNTTFVGLKLNNKTDADIIKWIGTENKQRKIKDAIRNEIDRGK